MKYGYITRMLEQSSHTVCLLGWATSMDCGCMDYRQEEGNYDIEQKYGHSPDELFTAAYYNTRPQHFFRFYKDEVISKLGEPDACMRTLARMEEDGHLDTIITRELFNLPRRAGCKNVIELHGSVFDNVCPHCGKRFSIEFMREAKGVPLCPDCKVPIRPVVNLVGDMVDSQKVSRATVEVAKAETLLILGCSMNAPLAANFLTYFNGKRVILVHEFSHPSDHQADFVYYAKPRDVLPLLYPESVSLKAKAARAQAEAQTEARAAGKAAEAKQAGSEKAQAEAAEQDAAGDAAQELAESATA